MRVYVQLYEYIKQQLVLVGDVKSFAYVIVAIDVAAVINKNTSNELPAVFCCFAMGHSPLDYSIYIVLINIFISLCL